MILALLICADIADITPPVVENLVFDQNNQTIPANNKTISFTFDAYDSDGSALSLDHTVTWIYVPNNIHYDEYGRDLKADTINSVTDSVTEVTTYTVTFDLDSDWEGSMEVRELRIGDVYGNALKFDFYDEDSNTSSMNATIDIPVNNAISVTDIDVDAAKAHTPPDVANPNVNVSSYVNFNNVDNVWEVSLTDTVTAVLIPMEVTVAPTANFQKGDEICAIIEWFYCKKIRYCETCGGYSVSTYNCKFQSFICYRVVHRTGLFK